MNNEIKEILKILKECEFGACITKHNSTVLLDYITNLQQENERLKDRCHDLYEENVGLKAKIEKAIEHIEEIWKSAEGGNIYAITIVGLIRADLLNILQNGSDKE